MSRYLLGDVVFFNLPTMFCSQPTKVLSVKEHNLLAAKANLIGLTRSNHTKDTTAHFVCDFNDN